MIFRTEKFYRRQMEDFARRERAWERERRELIDRIMYLAGQTWTPPPIEDTEEEPIPFEPIEWPELEPID